MSGTIVYATTGFGAERKGTAVAYSLRRHLHGVTLYKTAPDYEQSDELGVQISGLGSMPMWLSVHPNGASAYTVDMSGDGSVHSHTVSPLSGALTPINSQPSRGAGPCHLTVLHNFVLCANYSGGTISVLPLESGGGLGPAVEYKDHGTTQGSGAGVHVRQDMAHPHQILLDPSHKYCFVPDLGTNKVHSYLWHADTGALTEASELLLHDGAGPRHMCFSPDGTCAYVLGELDNSVTVCTHVDGNLEVVQTLNSLMPGTEHASAGGGAEIIMSPDGRFIYATIRGTCAVIEDPYPSNHAFNVIASFAVSRVDGTLSLLANTPSGGNMPWTMTWAENGDFLIVQNQHAMWDGPDGGVNDGTNGSGDGGLTVFPVDRITGALREPTKAVALPHCMAVTVVQQVPKSSNL